MLTISPILPCFGRCPLAPALRYSFCIAGSSLAEQAERTAAASISAPIPRQGQAAQSTQAIITDYIKNGFIHIVPKGLDHILFVLGLFFYAARWQPLLGQVTLFTLAHSLTLFLASTGYIVVSPTVIEPMIAASIIYIASVLCGKRRTQREVAEVAGVTEVTIRNRYKELIQNLNIELEI